MDEKIQEAQTIIDSMIGEQHEKVTAAIEKYAPIVARLHDLEFAGLYSVVLDERTRRMARLMAANPMIMKMAIERFAREQG